MQKALQDKAKEIIENIKYITIASTSKDGQPWNTPVFSAYDDSFNFFWGSHHGSQHSKNIKFNQKVFLVIYDSTTIPGKGEGVYIQAIAKTVLNQKEVIKALKLLTRRHEVPYWKLHQFKGKAPIRIYKAVPKKVWVNSESEIDGHYIDTRTEVSLL